ncbi:MAG: hypothetical protein GTO53_00840, partial [Planctomycetales bacterium]|nr:hypothetical protein [Planctomycetales bacterium]
MVARDGDPYRHWAVGEQMLQTRDIMRVDTFSHTRAETPVIASEWLAELVFAAAGRWLDLDGLALVAALVIATALALL